MYVATIVGIIASIVQVGLNRIIQKRWDHMQLVTLTVFIIFGGMTLYFHNPIFVKWKPTVIFWVFSFVMFASQLFTDKPVIQRLMKNIPTEGEEIPSLIWKRLNMMWTIFFMILGCLNLYIAYHYDSDTWVNFKFYGITSAMIGFSIFQAIYLSRYLVQSARK